MYNVLAEREREREGGGWVEKRRPSPFKEWAYLAFTQYSDRGLALFEQSCGCHSCWSTNERCIFMFYDVNMRVSERSEVKKEKEIIAPIIGIESCLWLYFVRILVQFAQSRLN